MWFDNVFIFKFISKFSIQRIFNMNGNNSKNNLCKCIRLPFSLETWMKMCRTNCMSFSTLTKHNMFRSTNEKKIEAFFSLFSSPLIVHWKKNFQHRLIVWHYFLRNILCISINRKYIEKIEFFCMKLIKNWCRFILLFTLSNKSGTHKRIIIWRFFCSHLFSFTIRSLTFWVAVFLSLL